MSGFKLLNVRVICYTARITGTLYQMIVARVKLASICQMPSLGAMAQNRLSKSVNSSSFYTFVFMTSHPPPPPPAPPLAPSFI